MEWSADMAANGSFGVPTCHWRIVLFFMIGDIVLLTNGM